MLEGILQRLTGRMVCTSTPAAVSCAQDAAYVLDAAELVEGIILNPVWLCRHAWAPASAEQKYVHSDKLHPESSELDVLAGGEGDGGESVW